jgi:AcrR family transcriptional regulator
MQDKRSVKTKRSIHEAFFSLLEKKALSQITVAEISRKAEIGRGTFYLHYKDVYDLYEHIEEKLYEDLVGLFDMAYPSNIPTNLVALTDNITEYIANQQRIFVLMIQNKNNGNILEKLKKIFTEKVVEEAMRIVPEVKDDKDYEVGEAIFVVAGVIGVLEEWLKGDLIASQKEISSMLHCILLKIENYN